MHSTYIWRHTLTVVSSDETFIITFYTGVSTIRSTNRDKFIYIAQHTCSHHHWPPQSPRRSQSQQKMVQFPHWKSSPCHGGDINTVHCQLLLILTNDIGDCFLSQHTQVVSLLLLLNGPASSERSPASSERSIMLRRE